MLLEQHINLGSKTTMRIGGTARYFAFLETTADVEEASAFAMSKNIPLLVLGAGSNTLFANGVIEALIVQLRPSRVTVHAPDVVCGCGNTLATLINELASVDLDLSPLTGIPGTVGGALFGNAGQGSQGIWMDSFVQEVTVWTAGKWQTLSREQCEFGYRESRFKHERSSILWQVALRVPSRPANDIRLAIESILKRRIETQPHIRTAGSCFKSVGLTPAWRLIDEVGLRGARFGDIQIAEKHANFLLNTGKATYEDAKNAVRAVRAKVPVPLDTEMRFIDNDGSLAF